MNKMTTLTHRSIVRDGVFGKAYQTAVPNIAVAPGSTRELTSSETLYTDSIDYLLGGALTLRNGRIDKYQFDEGYCQAARDSRYNARDNFTFCYYSKDHLGNVRSVVTKSTFTNAVTEEQKTHYYPFGGIIADLSTGRSVQNRLYNGKELDISNNLWWYDYGARQYAPTAPRFTTTDPLAEKYYGWNMYMYCVNNPVRYIDPDGRDGKVTGSGTKNDPYVITAIYIYKNGDFSEDQIKAFNSGLNAYNKRKTIKIKEKNEYTYIKYNLSSRGVDDPEEERKKTLFTNTYDEPRYYGNIVGKNPNGGNEYGSADNKSVDFNISNINTAIKQGADKYRLYKGVMIHEVAHNLGLNHSDNVPEMSEVSCVEHMQQIGPSYKTYDYPSVSVQGMSKIFDYRDQPLNGVGRIWTEK